MKPLADRFADRAKRRAENASESTMGTNTAFGAAMIAVEAAVGLMNGLSDDDKSIVETAMRENRDDFTSLAEDDTGNFKYAGVGVVNPLVVPPSDANQAVPAEAVEKQAGNGGGWGAGNVNGRSVAEQTDGGASANNGEAVETPEEIAEREKADEAAKKAAGKGTTTTVAAKTGDK